MDDHEIDQIFKLLQQIDARLVRIEEKLNHTNTFESISYKDPDPLIPQTVELILQHKKASASLFQRHLQIGYARAASILDQVEKIGIVGPIDGASPRIVYEDQAKAYLSDRKNGLMNNDIS